MLKWRFPELSNEHFKFEEGYKEIMLDSLAIKLDKTRSELELVFAELQKC